MKYSNILNRPFAISALMLVALFSACTKNYDLYNTNPNTLSPDDLQKDNVGAGTFIPTMQVNVFYNLKKDDWKYQVQQNLNADAFSGYFAPVGFGDQSNANYNLNVGWNIWPFRVAYEGIMGNWKALKGFAAGAPQVIAVSDILKVEGMHRVTDIYGPIPYSKFGVNALVTPYDSQETVYNTFFQELDNAIKVLTDYVAKNPSDNSLSKFDLVYNGNYKQWIKFANSLKLRLAIRIAYVNPSLAKTKAEEAVANSFGLLTTQADNALVVGGKGITTNNGLRVDDIDYKNSRMNASIESILKGFNDGRLSKYFQISPNLDKGYLGTVGDFKGVRTGIVMNGGTYEARTYSVNLTEQSPVQYMCAAEVSFLRAEGALRGWNMGGTPQSFYEQGIRLSFAQYGANGVDEYIADNTSTQAAYTDPTGITANNVPAGSNLLSTTTVKWDESASKQIKLERIITQKWIAVFPDGQEAWSEYRRTGYPKIFPVVNNASGGRIDTQIQIRRLPFSDDEYKTNTAEVSKAVALLGGADTGGTRLWWDIPNKNL